ncbi:MAG: HAD-IA family hydrolase [Acidimicrobiales bacterium]
MAPLALFDLDNTLVDRVATFKRWAVSFSDQRGLDPEAVVWLCEADGDGFTNRRDIFVGARDRFGLRDSADDLVSAYWNEYVSFYRPDPAVINAITRLREAGWKTAVITNGPPTQHEKVSRSGLLGLFDAYCVSEEIGAQKPDIRIFTEAFRRCGYVQGDVGWMIGDTAEPDIGGGISAGLKTIWIHRGREWSVDRYRPDAQAGTIEEAVDILLAP